MERFIIGAALAAAGLFALSSAMGGGAPMSWSLSIGGHGLSSSASSGSGGQSITAEPMVFAAKQFRFEDGFARLVVIPEDRADLSVRLVQAGGAQIPMVRMHAGRLIIDGDLGQRLRGCNDVGAALADRGTVPIAQAPVIEVRTPREVDAAIMSAGYVEIGPSESVDLEVIGCGRVGVAPINGALDLHRAGTSVVRVEAAATADVEGLGDGLADLGVVAERADLSVSGSGRISVREARGELDAQVRGSGGIDVAGGTLQEASATVIGSGLVKIGAGVVELDATVTGSGGVTVDAAVATGEAAVVGSGIITVRTVTGALDQRVVGSGRVVANAPQPSAPTAVVPLVNGQQTEPQPVPANTP